MSQAYHGPQFSYIRMLSCARCQLRLWSQLATCWNRSSLSFWEKSADMFARVAVLLACLHLVAANYRTCKCSIRTGSAANSPELYKWSRQLHSCFGCSFPGIHVSCNEVKSWCPTKCYNEANQGFVKMVCRSLRANTRLYVHSQVMSNCGGTRMVHYELCWMHSPRFSRWLGKKCWPKTTKKHWLVKSS